MSLSTPDAATMASWDAVETAARIRRGEVSAADVVEAAIARAEAAAHLGAVVATRYDGARADARKSGAGVFAGVPTFIKDLAEMHGVATAWGSRAAGAYVSRRSAPIVRRFEETGAVILGKSATPELGMTATTEPIGQPPCRNPWDPSRSSGGSSGGAASLVAAGVVPLAHASDGGGSIRIPAACCGLVGFKASRRRLDMEGSILLPINVATDGVVTRSVRDTVAFHEAVEARHRPRGVGALGAAGGPPGRLRVGVFVDAPIGTAVDAEVAEAASAAGRELRAMGHEVRDIACPFEGAVLDDFLSYWGLLAWLQTRSARVMLHRGYDRAKVEPWTVGLAGTFTAQPRAVLAAVGRLRDFGRTFARVMQRYDVLVSPTLAEPAPALGYLATDVPFEEAFRRLRGYAPFTPIYNTVGAPAISLPLGRSAKGLPIGVQLAAAPGRDRLLLDLALAVEAAHPWETTAPRERWAAR